ncbi:MAG: DUF4097 family beta strand repeat-containing protein, partial [Acetatifactor sp.]|nr:DUF4097 family beta strand repeat-containing protein [Acetatifactor sp.]
MTKSEYMEALQKKLECFNRELQQEIVEDYEQHFAEGIAAGKTEEEIVAELGSIEDMIQELSEEDLRQSGTETRGQKEDSEENVCAEEDSQSNIYSGEYKAVVIDGAVGDVNIEQSDNGQIYIEYQNNGSKEYRFYQYEEDGVFYAGIRRDKGASAKEAKRAVKIMLFGKTLNVDLDNPLDFGKTFAGVWNSSGGITLNVRIPAEMPRLEVKTVSGDINVRNVTPEQLNINSTSGDIEIRHVTVDRLRLNATSGDITANRICSSDADVCVTSGDVELNDADVGTFHLQTASGDFSGNYMRGNRMTVGTGSGDVEFDGCFERYSIRTGSGDVDLRAEAGAKEIRVVRGSGDGELNQTALERTEVA